MAEARTTTFAQDEPRPVDVIPGLMWNRSGLPAIFPLQVKTPAGKDYFLTLIDAETGNLAAEAGAIAHQKSRWPEMSARHNPTEDLVAPGALPATETPGAPICAAQSHWQQDCLLDARGILADIAQHPDSLVVLACQVICAHSPDPTDPTERADALGVIRLQSMRSPEGVNAAPKGGAA